MDPFRSCQPGASVPILGPMLKRPGETILSLDAHHWPGTMLAGHDDPGLGVRDGRSDFGVGFFCSIVGFAQVGQDDVFQMPVLDLGQEFAGVRI